MLGFTFQHLRSLYFYTTCHKSFLSFFFNPFPFFSFFIYTHSLTRLDSYFFLPAISSGMKTLTVKSPLSVPYLFFTRMLYLPVSDVLTPVMVKLANLPDSNLRMQCSSDVISLSFFSHVTSGTGSPEMLQVRLRALRTDGRVVLPWAHSSGLKMQYCECVGEGLYLALLNGDDIRKASCHTSTTWRQHILFNFNLKTKVFGKKNETEVCLFSLTLNKRHH